MDRAYTLPLALPQHRPPRPPIPAVRRYGDWTAGIVDARAQAVEGSDTLWLRPITPRDCDALQRLFHRLTATEIRRRFLHAMREMPPGMAQRLSAPDGLREQAWVIASSAQPGNGELHGVGRMFTDPTSACAEFSLLVERAYTVRGLGRLLLQTLMGAARDAGMHELWSHVAHDNQAMLHLARSKGGSLERVPGDTGVVLVRIPLQASDGRLNAPDPLTR